MHEDDCTDIDKRVSIVEVTTSAISKDLGDIKDVLNKMAISLQSLAVWEERHANMIDTLKRAFKAIEKMEDRVDTVEKLVAPLNVSVEALTKKIDAIEPHMPNIKLSSGWVFKIIFGLVSIEALGLLGSVIYFLLHK